MSGPFEGTTVDAYTVVDLNAGLNLTYDIRLALTVQNLLDHRHIEFVGAPEVGRLALLRATKSF
jgi:iron complex outermembrane receptor protein